MISKSANKLGIQLFQSADMEYNPEKVDTIENFRFPHIKPSGGVWTSTYTKKESTPSDWLYFCKMEQLISEKKIHGLLLKPKKECNIVEIDTINDLNDIIKKYPDEPDEGYPLETRINFEGLARDFDGLHLTYKGQWETRFTQPNLYGWDTESTIWFNPDCLEQIGKIDLTKFCSIIEDENGKE